MFAKKARSQSNMSLPFCDFLYQSIKLIGAPEYLRYNEYNEKRR